MMNEDVEKVLVAFGLALFWFFFVYFLVIHPVFGEIKIYNYTQKLGNITIFMYYDEPIEKLLKDQDQDKK